MDMIAAAHGLQRIKYQTQRKVYSEKSLSRHVQYIKKTAAAKIHVFRSCASEYLGKKNHLYKVLVVNTFAVKSYIPQDKGSSRSLHRLAHNM